MLDVLVVDDDDIVRGCVADALAAAGHSVVQATDGEHALSCLATKAFDLAICDVQMPKLDGLTLFRRLRRESPGTAVVLMTTYGKIPDAVGTLRDGAIDYVTKPFDPDVFVAEVVGPLDERRMHMKKFELARARFVEREAGGKLVGESLAMRQLGQSTAVVARSDVAVIVWGEPGTGKKLVARTIHGRSARRDGPFVAVPCASLSDRMAQPNGDSPEAAARAARDHWFRAAEGGTLVLDGIDALPLGAQHALLRVVDEPVTRARRSADWRPRGVRLVSTARRHPATWVSERAFIEPLFFRLNTMQIHVPSLAEREGDTYLLVCHFLRELTPPRSTVPGLTPAAWKTLLAHRFAGNVRELSWAIEHGIAAAGGEEIGVEHLPPEISAGAPLSPR